MVRSLLGLTLMLLVAPVLAQEPLVIEAEDCTTPQSAWVKDQQAPDKWTLWSTDDDAQRKWSGGVVLQSPAVLQDREKPEDGAPVLHTVLAGIPRGVWVITIKYARDLGVSLDGKAWQRLSDLGGRLGKFEIPNGTFEFWVDDRYALKQGAGQSYYDNVTLTPAVPERNGIANGDFEYGADLAHSGWSWSTRDNSGAATLVPDGHTGRGLQLQHDGEKDWTVENSSSSGIPVKPGQTWRLGAWVKCQDTTSLELVAVGLYQGHTVDYALASNSVTGTTGWQRLETTVAIPRDCDQIVVRLCGFGKVRAWVDEIALTPGPAAAPPASRPKVTGWAKTRVAEKLGRGMLALPLEGDRVYLGWRLLSNDPAGVAFNVYRAAGRGRPVKLNDAPLTRTTDFTADQPTPALDSAYWVRAVVAGKEQAPSAQAFLPRSPAAKPYLAVKLQGDYSAQAAGVGDLDGDGSLEVVIRQPAVSIDPGDGYWERGQDTYKLEAYRLDGTFLWRKDLGWGIEPGIWYAPYVVYDLDGDGCAEVAAKTSEGDPRGSDGRVASGPEYLTIFDGKTGKVRTRTPWLSRQGYGGGLTGYNLASRNQLGLAYLDGKTPCLLVARGTYNAMNVAAYQVRAGKLERLWQWSNREEDGTWRGQGAHWMHAGDVDEDGRDEVLLGATALDDDGKGLWNAGLGHPDFFYLGDLDPARPGLEVSYFIEPPRPRDGVCMVDARTGKIIWGLGEQSYHVGAGMTADIDPTHPGCEVWGNEDGKGDPQGNNYGGAPPRWLFSAQGEVLARGAAVPSVSAVYWDADSQREVLAGNRVEKYRGQVVTQGLEGSQLAWGDFLGDWREEIITSVPGELRLYSTTVPATDRRACLLQDPIYRTDVAHVTMGYPKPPTPGRFLPQLSPAMWMTGSRATVRFGETVQAKLVIAAPGKQATAGTVRLEAPAGLTVTPTSLGVEVPAGQTREAAFEISLKLRPAPLSALQTYVLKAVLDGPASLQSQMSLKREDLPLEGALLAQAEDFAAQGEGEVKLREDKAGAMGKAFSHWDARGHWLSWRINVPVAGKYLLVLRYCTPVAVQRQIEIDGGTPIVQGFPGTGGFGGPENEWGHFVVRDAKQVWLGLDLTVGEHTIRLTNVDGRGMNLDYLALVAMK